MDIKVQLTNYKKHKDTEVDVNTNVLIVEGDNETGKSSFITALEEAWMAKSITPDPITHGEKKGEKTYVIPDKNGNAVIIKHQFSEKDKKGTFTFVDHRGIPVKKLAEMRAILGEYQRVTLEQIYHMVSTVGGRREFLKSYILPMLPQKAQDRISYIDANVETGGDLYKKRAEANSRLEAKRHTVQGYKPTEEEEEKRIKAKEYKATYEELKKQVEEYDKVKQQNNIIKDKLSSIKAILSSLEGLNDFCGTSTLKTSKRGLEQTYRALSNEIREQDGIEDVKKRKEKADKYMADVERILRKKQNYDDSVKELDEAHKEWKKLDNEIGALREERAKIFEDASLPMGLKIDGDSIEVDGYEFSGEQISESRAKLILAQLMFEMFDAKLVNMGNYHAFNKERLTQLVKFAEKHNKLVVLERVVEGMEDVRIVTKIDE